MDTTIMYHSVTPRPTSPRQDRRKLSRTKSFLQRQVWNSVVNDIAAHEKEVILFQDILEIIFWRLHIDDPDGSPWYCGFAGPVRKAKDSLHADVIRVRAQAAKA